MINKLLFELSEDETIVMERKPLKNLIWYFFIRNWALMTTLFILFGVMIVTEFHEIISPFWPYILLAYIILTISLIPISYLEYDKEYYWITNQRIIRKRGIVGYSITSIPLERISDLITSRSFLEYLLGIASLRIHSLAGQAGIEASILGIKNPEDLKKVIISLIEKRRKEKELMF